MAGIGIRLLETAAEAPSQTPLVTVLDYTGAHASQGDIALRHHEKLPTQHMDLPPGIVAARLE
jgi:hypothetical protein